MSIIVYLLSKNIMNFCENLLKWYTENNNNEYLTDNYVLINQPLEKELNRIRDSNHYKL